MALLTCSECSGKVSSKADKCPHCGSPVDQSNQQASPRDFPNAIATSCAEIDQESAKQVFEIQEGVDQILRSIRGHVESMNYTKFWLFEGIALVLGPLAGFGVTHLFSMNPKDKDDPSTACLVVFFVVSVIVFGVVSSFLHNRLMLRRVVPLAASLDRSAVQFNTLFPRGTHVRQIAEDVLSRRALSDFLEMESVARGLRHLIRPGDRRDAEFYENYFTHKPKWF